jgi:hypothetical protein
LDYYTALSKAGLGQYVPNQYKLRSRSSIHSNRLAQSQVKDWQQYTQTVWPEYLGHSFIEVQKPLSPMQLKAEHAYDSRVFSKAITQLQAFESAGRW